MKETNRIKVTRLLIPVLLLAMLVVSSCKPKATHLTQNLENSSGTGQRSTHTPGESTQITGQETAPAQPPTLVNEPTATSVESVTTQGASVTLPAVQTSSSPVIILTPTATSKSTIPQAATSTLAPTQIRTATPTQTRTPTKTATLTPSPTLQTGWEPVIILTPTATLKSTTPPAATQTSSPLVSPTKTFTPTKTPTPTKTSTPTATVALTPSPTLQTGWEGEWTAYLAQPDGTYGSGTLIVTISGDSVIGVFDTAGITMNLEGSLQLDGIIAIGDYTLPAASGRFKWVIQEDSYIIGNINNERAFCAARGGSPQPDPCGYFDPL